MMKKRLIVFSLILIISMLSTGEVLGQVAASLPDLIIENISIKKTEVTGYNNIVVPAYNYEIYVKNLGQVDAINSYIKIDILPFQPQVANLGRSNEEYRCTKGIVTPRTIKAGESIRDLGDYFHPVKAGQITVTATADIYNSVIESNENNNVKIQTFNVDALIDNSKCPYGCKDACCQQGDTSCIVTALTCTDSDQGRNYNTKGTLTIAYPNGGKNGHTDVCGVNSGMGFTDPKILIEHSCEVFYAELNKTQRVYESYSCSYGCKDGACCQQNSPCLASTQAQCTDTDGGKNFFVKGTTNPTPLETSNAKIDRCENSNTLVEYYCNIGTTATDMSYTCPNGCSNGACLTTPTTIQCTDSDGGKDYYVKGTTDIAPTKAGGDALDYCNDGNTVVEYFCTPDGSNGGASSLFYTCPYGCSNGACKTTSSQTTCTDTDNGNSYYIKGKVTTRDETAWDYCKDSNTLVETNCEELGGDIVEYYCPQGCQDGACIGASTELDLTEPITCEANQCEIDGNCYLPGFRKGGNYCSDTGAWTGQKSGEEACDNNFECSSNVCVDGNCISAGLMRKIVNWFKGLFG